MEFKLDKWIAAQKHGEVLIEHVGDFSLPYIDAMLPAMEEKLQDKVEPESVRRKVFHIFVECVQNLYHHIEPEAIADREYGNKKLGAILLTKDETGCRITTGNFVPRTKSSELKNQIDKINSLNSEQLRDLYRITVKKDGFSKKGGAGLGMIDMARKSGHKLNYQFYPLKDAPDVMFFSFDVCIN